MVNLYQMLPFIIVILPIVSCLGLLFIEESHTLHCYTAGVTLTCLVLVSLLFPAIWSGNVLEVGIETAFISTFDFRVDSLGLFVGFVSCLLWSLASFYSIEYLESSHAPRRYDTFSLLSLGGMMGVVFTGNLFSLYIFFELLSVASAILVFHEETPEALKAGFKYLFLSIGGGLILLMAIIANYSITGHVRLADIGLGLSGHPWFPYIFWGYIIGFGVKAGLFPLHIWLPEAHPVAPTPASALLSGVMIKAGAYGILRTVFNIVSVDELMPRHNLLGLGLVILALVTILLGSLLAITQVEIKRMLAYSSISQIGYIILGVALLTPLGLVGGVFHVLAHAVMKGALFLCAGVIISTTGLRYIKDFRGIGRYLPLTTTVFSLAALSMIGLPPFIGFISKWFLALGSLQLIRLPGYGSAIGITCLAVLLLSSLLNLVYYGPIIIGAWFYKPQINPGKTGQRLARVNERAHWRMVVPLLILGAIILSGGIFPGSPLLLVEKAGKVYFELLSLW
jgi:multicomponent Na+:H+ antiporter subunit D